MKVTIIEGTPSDVAALLREMKEGDTVNARELAKKINEEHSKRLRVGFGDATVSPVISEIPADVYEMAIANTHRRKHATSSPTHGTPQED